MRPSSSPPPTPDPRLCPALRVSGASVCHLGSPRIYLVLSYGFVASHLSSARVTIISVDYTRLHWPSECSCRASLFSKPPCQVITVAGWSKLSCLRSLSRYFVLRCAGRGPRSAQPESLDPDQLHMALLQLRKFVCTAPPVFATNYTLLDSPNARNLLSPTTPCSPSDLAVRVHGHSTCSVVLV